MAVTPQETVRRTITATNSATPSPRADDPINVKWFGADPTGAENSTAPIRKAIARALLLSQSSVTPGYAASLTLPTVFLPDGIYYVDGDLSNGQTLSGIRFLGSNAIILAAPGITAFSGIRYMVEFRGITVRGGAVAYSISTNNLNSSLLTWKDCEMMEQTSRCIETDNSSNSTQALFTNCKFSTPGQAAAQILVALTGDYIKFKDCWVEPGTTAAAAFDMTNGNLILDGIVGVPNNLFAWVEMNQAGSLTATNSRFGAETGGALDCLVVNRMAANTGTPVFPTSISIRDCECYTSGPLIRFFGIPNVVSVTNCRGLANPTFIEMESAISAGDLATIGNLDSIFHIDFNSQKYGPYVNPVGAPIIAREGVPLVEARTLTSSRPLVADIVVNSAGSTGGFTPVIDASNVTASVVANEFAIDALQWIATADNAYQDYSYTNVMSGKAAGAYTAVFDIVNLANVTIRPIFQASNAIHVKTLAKGAHIICVPFWYDGGAAQTIRVANYALANGATLQWQRFRIYAGQRIITSKRAEFEGTAAPVAGQWFRGDMVYNTARINDSLPTLWECYVAGSPGIWAPQLAQYLSGTYTPTLTGVANVATSLAYVAQYMRVSDVVTVSGKIEVQPTADITNTLLGISLPIASEFLAQEDCGGTGVAAATFGYCGGIAADAANNRAQLQFQSSGTTNAGWAFHFTYRIR